MSRRPLATTQPERQAPISGLAHFLRRENRRPVAPASGYSLLSIPCDVLDPCIFMAGIIFPRTAASPGPQGPAYSFPLLLYCSIGRPFHGGMGDKAHLFLISFMVYSCLRTGLFLRRAPARRATSRAHIRPVIIVRHLFLPAYYVFGVGFPPPGGYFAGPIPPAALLGLFAAITVPVLSRNHSWIFLSWLRSRFYSARNSTANHRPASPPASAFSEIVYRRARLPNGAIVAPIGRTPWHFVLDGGVVHYLALYPSAATGDDRRRQLASRNSESY